ncbi:MAG: amidohydrolase family protein [bacterium]|nr:amidohydrolase family protein [bacterium]
MKVLLGLASLLLLFLACTSENRPTLAYDSIAYVGVNIIDGTGSEPKMNSVIIIKDGKITKIGEMGKMKIPETAKVVNAKGKWVIPGLIDMHAHVTVLPVDSNFVVEEQYDKQASLEALKTLLAFGITTVRNPAAPTENAIELRNLIHAGEEVGPTIFTTGYALNRTKAFFGPFSAAATEKEIREEIKKQDDAGVDFIKVYASLKPKQIEIAVDEAHKRGLKVIGHLQNTSWTTASNLGIDFVTHASPWSIEYLPEHLQRDYRPTFLGRLFWLENVDYDGDQIQSMLQSMYENGVSVDPTLIAFHTKFWGDDPMYTQSQFLPLAPEMVTSIWKKTTFTSDWTEDDYDRAKKQWKKLLELTKRMYDKGILITAGTDFPNPWVVPGISMHQELKLLSDAGISNLEVLKIATLNGATALGIEKATGSIEVGKEADLIFLGANPIFNIQNTRKIEFILNNGVKYMPNKLNDKIGK